MAHRLLIIAPSWVGDAVLSQPLLAALKQRHPIPNIDVLAPRWSAPVYARMAEVSEIIDSPFDHGELALFRRWKLGRHLARRYDQAFVLPNSIKSALVPFFAGIRRRTGYLGEHRYGIVNDWRQLDNVATPKLVDQFRALAVATLDSVPLENSRPSLFPDAIARAQLIDRLSLSLQKPVAVLCPGAEFGPAKRWPPEHFAALARRLDADGYAIWIVGSPKDSEAADTIVRAAPFSVNLCGRTDLASAIDLMSAAALVISNDSGLMHIAAALGRPMVAIFGSSSPKYTPPLSPVARIARIDLPCSPCYQRECPLGHLRCLRELSAEAVYDDTLKLTAASAVDFPAEANNGD